MPGQISLHARFNAQEGKGAELAAILQELIDIVQQEEGAKFYSLNRGREDQSDVVWFYEIYEDMAAMDGHGKFPEFGEVFGRARAVMDGAPELIRSDVIGFFSRV